MKITKNSKTNYQQYCSDQNLVGYILSNPIDKRHGSWILKETASQPNRKVYFNEFVQNSLGGNMDMIIFDLRGYGGY